MSTNTDELMDRVLDGVDLGQAIDEMVKARVKESVESMMKAERKVFLEQDTTPQNKANGYYRRGFDCRHGSIDKLKVPRDRQGEFQTQVLERNKRRDGWLEEIVCKWCQHQRSCGDSR